MSSMFPTFSKVLEEFSKDPFVGQFLKRMPPMDVLETPEEYIIRADVPGLTKEQVDVDIKGNSVCVTGNHKEELGKFLVQQRITWPFTGCMQLPFQPDPETVKAKLELGVLELTIPKVEDKRNKVSIQ